MAGCVRPCSFPFQRNSWKAVDTLLAIQVLGFGKRPFAFLPTGAFWVLRPWSALAGSGVKTSGSVCASGWERNPVIWKEGTDEADAEQEDPVIWGSLRGRNKQEKMQILLLKSWI